MNEIEIRVWDGTEDDENVFTVIPVEGAVSSIYLTQTNGNKRRVFEFIADWPSEFVTETLIDGKWVRRS